jgi:hypothetical protein
MMVLVLRYGGILVKNMNSAAVLVERLESYRYGAGVALW